MNQEGKKGIEHSCSNLKKDIAPFKKTLNESSYSDKEKLLIWDFYVSDHEYNSKHLGKINDKLFEKLKDAAGACVFCTIRSKSINNTLKNADLYDKSICIEHPRAVLMRKHMVKSNENEEFSFVPANGENEVACLLRHIRNALAHNHIYFFDNGNVLLEDYEKKTLTAKILVTKETLMVWIEILRKECEI